jgi:hypothetical protein
MFRMFHGTATSTLVPLDHVNSLLAWRKKFRKATIIHKAILRNDISPTAAELGLVSMLKDGTTMVCRAHVCAGCRRAKRSVRCVGRVCAGV